MLMAIAARTRAVGAYQGMGNRRGATSEKKMELANFVVWTEGGVESHRQQLERIFA
jgi:hypothetical protein